MKNLISVGQRLIGDGQPCFIIAEIGSNHNQDFDLAIEHIDAAIDAGVDAVKFQTFKAESHVSKYAKMPSYLMEGESVQGLLQTLELNRSWQQPFQDYCNNKGIIFFSSPCDYDAVDSLEEIGVTAHKVASFDLPDLDLIEYIAKTGKPIILSTGCADWMDIQRAVDTCRSAGNENVILLQCTSLYPAPAELSNLRAMTTMRSSFRTLTGYSDHTIGNTVPMAAVALGACMIEKHFTLSRKLPGPDHSFAIEPHELKDLVQQIRLVEAAIGDGVKNGPRPEEMEMAEKVRRSLHASQDISKGERITVEMLCTKRPGSGISPFLRDQVIGRTAKRDILADEWISWDMI